jgi:hypothetical protein
MRKTVADLLAQFTCFTGIKVQILTLKTLQHVVLHAQDRRRLHYTRWY